MERDRFLEESRKSCPFCSMIHDKEHPHKSDIVVETPHFLTIVDVAPSVPYFFVTFPKEHALSYFELDPTVASQFNTLVETLIEKTGRPNFFFFENGAGNRDSEDGYGVVSHQSVYHCHMNMIFLPEGEHMIPQVLERFNALEVPHLDVEAQGYFPTPVIRRATEGKPYFYVRQKNRSFIAMEQGEKVVPSQFVRKAVTEVFHREDDAPFWDWKTITPEERLKIERLKVAMRCLF